LEEALAFTKYVSTKELGRVSELATKLGKSPGYITKRIMLRELPQEFKEAINGCTLKPSIPEEELIYIDKFLK
jgi:ParB family transcriptional regulator, chromosome partitioning protein